MHIINGIPVWGEHDEATLAQIQRCAAHDNAAAAALMADGHKGYAMPIGGVIGYHEAVSPNGVGFDISCLAAGTPVTTQYGYWLPIEQISPKESVICWDGQRIRPVIPHMGMIKRGVKSVLKITLQNGRTLLTTADHQILTGDGWKMAFDLSQHDSVACHPFVGLAYETAQLDFWPTLSSYAHRAELEKHGLCPQSMTVDKLAVLIRLLAYVSGDGHLPKDGAYIAIYTTNELDAADIIQDFARLGYHARSYRRRRRSDYQTEILIRVNSVALHALFAGLGCPVGRKSWSVDTMAWLLGMPAWLRAQFLSAFCSAEMMSPRLMGSHIPNLQLKQAGTNPNAINLIAKLLGSLNFEVSLAQSGPMRGERCDYVLQILGGEAAQIRFVEEVGFCYAFEKRIKAARIASVYWQRAALVERRQQARDRSRSMKQAGVHWKEVLQIVSTEYDVSPGFIYHAIYDERGKPRRPPHMRFQPQVDGEICWVPITHIENGDDLPVYDIVTDDPAHAFFASGIVVHNCGNKAVRTNIRADDIRNKISTIMDEVFSTVVFGVGQSSGKARDHALFDDPAWNELSFLRPLKQLAREQLGSVGSGNHYVDIFEDENGDVWVGVHFGSRGFGHKVCTGFLNLSVGRPFDASSLGESMDQPATVLQLDTELGQSYWRAMELAGRYAYAGRDFVVDQVLGILGAEALDSVHNHHNYAWRENVDGQELIVVRKGATPSRPGQRSFIGGSMGDISVITEGLEGEEAKASLYSTVHGAGRVMSRTQAAGKGRWVKRNGRRVREQLKPGLISREMMREWLKRENVELRGAGTDESPHVYRRLPEVLAQHAGSIRIVHSLKPLGVAMAGEDVEDPYKD